MTEERSWKEITLGDLRKLGEIARRDRNDFFARYPKRRNNFICSALCQGAALHYIDGKNGVKDFDIWSFYKADESSPFPPRRRVTSDFGKSKFGVNLDDKENGFVGRRIDLLGRSIEAREEESPFETLHRYLEQGKTASACALSKKAVVIIEPEEFLGIVVWPKLNSQIE